MVSKQFYIEFGKVLYAMAVADGYVSEKEKNAVMKLIKEKLAPIEDVPDQFGTDLAYYAEFAFETEEDFFDSKEAALESFNSYLKVSNTRLPKSVKAACLDILKTLAKSSGHKISAEEEQIIRNFEAKVLVE
jgi:uncharacterized tellurite resistance protein B-like protein